MARGVFLFIYIFTSRTSGRSWAWGGASHGDERGFGNSSYSLIAYSLSSFREQDFLESKEVITDFLSAAKLLQRVIYRSILEA